MNIKIIYRIKWFDLVEKDDKIYKLKIEMKNNLLMIIKQIIHIG